MLTLHRNFLDLKVILYGSEARGDVRSDSDIDLLLLVDMGKEFCYDSGTAFLYYFSFELNFSIKFSLNFYLQGPPGSWVTTCILFWKLYMRLLL